MRSLRHHPLIRIPLVALLMVTWIHFTNHCALGLMRPTAQAKNTFADCCGGKTNPRHDFPDSLRDCCKIKVTTAPAKAELNFDTSKFEVHVFALIQGFAARKTEPMRTAFVFDHGPPRCVSFAESVLQRSLFSHAPPSAV